MMKNIKQQMLRFEIRNAKDLDMRDPEAVSKIQSLLSLKGMSLAHIDVLKGIMCVLNKYPDRITAENVQGLLIENGWQASIETQK